MAEEYDKLVRDEIPRIVRENGDEPVTHVASGEEYGERLHDKLDEEVAEFHEDPSAEELADVRTVLDALAAWYDIDENDVAQCRHRKAESRGEFDDGIVLDSVVL